MSPRAQKPHTADLQILHYILHTLGNLVSINFFHHHTFLKTVSALGSGSMSLDPENNFGSPNLFSLFLPFHILLLHFFFLTPPWFYHFIFEMFSFRSYSFFFFIFVVFFLLLYLCFFSFPASNILLLHFIFVFFSFPASYDILLLHTVHFIFVVFSSYLPLISFYILYFIFV